MSLSREINIGFSRIPPKKKRKTNCKCRNVLSWISIWSAGVKKFRITKLSKWSEHYNKHAECKKIIWKYINFCRFAWAYVVAFEHLLLQFERKLERNNATFFFTPGDILFDLTRTSYIYVTSFMCATEWRKNQPTVIYQVLLGLSHLFKFPYR